MATAASSNSNEKSAQIDDEEYEAFEARHITQLASAAVPQHFWRKLYEKLLHETFDAGKFFQIVAEESEDGTRTYSVITLADLKADDPNNIFLIDHAWTFRPQVAREQLRVIPGLLDRICAVFDIEHREEAENFSDYGSETEPTPEQPHDGGTKHPENGDTGAEHCEAASGEEAAGGSRPQLRPNSSFVESIPASASCGSIPVETEEDRRINAVLHNMWQHIQTYTIRFTNKEPDESDMPLWYMPDEFGVRIGHSAEPNFRMVPMFYSAQGCAYSLLFPIRDVKTDEVVTRDYVDNMVVREHPELRTVLMHPWELTDLSSQKLEHVILDEKFFTEGRLVDILPVNAPNQVSGHKGKQKLRLLAEDFQLIDNLKSVEYEKVDKIEDADVVWARKHFNDYKGLFEKNPRALVNQFPYEAVLTVKDLLAASIQYANRDSSMNTETLRWKPDWFQTTFNLYTELPQFVAYYQHRARKGLDNTWIVKPWNLARGLDMHVTDNLSYIIRLVESGPKIVCKYIERPVLFRRPDNGNMVKFDLRYIVLVKSLQPLVMAMYNNFWIRFAINDFSLLELDDRETHLTVFNYSDPSKVLEMKCQDFTSQLEKLYANLKWSEMQQKINSAVKDLFLTISSGEPPRSMKHNAQSRAMYGIDVMLKWDSDDEKTRNVQVSIIEGNFMPDCERACAYYPDFADTVFKFLFMDEVDTSKLTML